ncbi:MAG: DUF4435 domain-containing protein [Bacteroidetes bacterium]|nr:MAG: DUF4435 domain-containing protein [Bacteroidota bacterium]
MASSLKSNQNSDRLEISNIFRPKSKPKTVFVYVEGEVDIAFWRAILQNYENEQFIFHINVPSKKGKQKALNELERNNEIFELVQGDLGKFLLICVDSDYDYLLYPYYVKQEKKSVAQKINQNPFVFQTYTYSIENLKCYAESLHAVCVTSTFNDERKIDFVEFLKSYSRIVYKLLIWNLLIYSKSEDNVFTLSTFCSTIILEGVKIEEYAETALQNLVSNVKNKIEELETAFPNYQIEIDKLAKELVLLGLKPENAYLFIQGHTIFDNVVLMLLKPLSSKLKSEREAKIKEDAKNVKNMLENFNSYKNKVQNISTVLSLNTKFENCFLFAKIKNDIEKYMDLLKM